MLPVPIEQRVRLAAIGTGFAVGNGLSPDLAANLMDGAAYLHRLASLRIQGFDTARVIVDALNAGVGGGSIHMTDAIELDPLPSVAVYEQL